MQNQGFTFVDRIGTAYAGWTVLDYYVARHPRADAGEWRHRIAAGRVLRRGETLACDDRIAGGDLLEYRRPPWVEPDVPVDAPLLYRDADVLVLNKPAGLPVTPGAGCQERTLLALVRARHDRDARPAHRLDAGTSGAIAFARSADAARRLHRAFQSLDVHKVYRALVEGLPGFERRSVDVPIGRVPHPPVGLVAGPSPDGRPAFTDLEVAWRDPAAGRSVVEARPRTGRSQQVRIHLAVAGHPLAGDPLYGPGGMPRPPAPGEDRPATSGRGGFLLHAWRLSLPGRDGRRIEVEAPLPEGLSRTGEAPRGA